MATALGVSADYLLGLTDDPQAKAVNTDFEADERLIVDIYRRTGWVGLTRMGLDQLVAQLPAPEQKKTN